MSKSTDLDRIIASEPINRTAAQVMRRGVHWEYRPDPGEVISDAPLPTKPTPAGTLDLTGKVFGRLTVLGLATGVRSGAAAWVCRCRCGYYCHRKARTLRDPSSDRKTCNRCDKVDQLRIYGGNWPDRTSE